MKECILAFGGTIASGKSTISYGIAQSLGWTYTSFGNYVRKVVKEQGLEEKRENLQEIGQFLINRGWDEFCLAVMNQVSWKEEQPLIIDGIRHLEALYTIKNIVHPMKVYLIFIAVDEMTRLNRVKKRNLNEGKMISIMDSHSTEEQVKEVLLQKANLVIYNNKPVDEMMREILLALEKL